MDNAAARMISSTAGASATGHELSTSLTPQDIQDTVSSWAWLGADNTSLAGAQITARPSGFVSGIEFQPDYRPDWSYYYPQALQTAQGLGANWVFMTPSLDILKRQSFNILGHSRQGPVVD